MTAFYRIFIGLILAITALFAVGTALFGLKAILWGIAIFYVVCMLGVLAVWWQENRQWSR